MTQATLHIEPPRSATRPAPPRWNPRSVGLIVLAWLILHVGGLFTPGLLDDVDSVYLEIAREMLRRHNYITPYIDGIRFFDKPPLMYWLGAGSMHIFGVHDWAGRLPLALLMLALLLATYALGLRLFASISPAAHPDRAALYSALALATCIGPYLYTRFYIPDIVVALWMTLGVHTFLIALDRIAQHSTGHEGPGAPSMPQSHRDMGGNIESRSALLPCLIFAAVLALNVLTKGLIGLVFPLGFVAFYLALTRQFHLIFKFHLIPSVLVFLAIAAPWHILAALRNPPIAMPSGLGLPPRAGWAWFYLYNEHIARFLSRRIPHDYGQTPIWLFWLFTLVWIMPWGAFLPGALRQHIRALRRNQHFLPGRNASTTEESVDAHYAAIATLRDDRRASLTLFLWSGLVLGFFTLSARQEYYGLPALPALALMVGGFLARAERYATGRSISDVPADAPYLVLDPASNRIALTLHRWLLLPLATLIALICGYFALTAPRPAPGTDLSTLLATNPDLYNLSLGHLFDLTGAAMGLFRGPLTVVALGMAIIGVLSYILRRSNRTYAANLAIAAGMVLVLIATHTAFVRFNPILGSKGLADAILTAQRSEPCNPQGATCTSQDLILIDGELTSGSTLLFYTGQPVHLVNGRINGPWFGSFWPDAPHVFETDASLDQLWAGSRRLFLLTYHPESRAADLSRFGPVRVLASAGGKSILTNQP